MIVFSDLDGTLLDHDTYSFEAARPALALLRREDIPLVLCSSKTRAEIERYRQSLKNTAPFSTIKGAAVFIPRGSIKIEDDFLRDAEGVQVREWGLPYARLVGSLKAIREETGLHLVGFSEMSVEEVGRRTGLDPARAEQAKKRDYSEPFVLVDPAAPLEVLEQAVKRQGLNLTRGGRFYHLIGDNDKGRAVRWLTAAYRKDNPDLTTIGLGDSSNDLPLLENVDRPVLVKKPSGVHETWRGEKQVLYTERMGPAGWNEALLTLLKKEERHE